MYISHSQTSKPGDSHSRGGVCEREISDAVICTWGYWCRRESDQRAVPVARSAMRGEGAGGGDVDVAG